MSLPVLLKASALFHFALALFHAAFWALFRWPQSLAGSGHVNTAVTQLLNVFLTFSFVLIGVLFWTAPAEPGVTLRVLAGGAALLWALRAALQLPFFGLRHPASALLFAVFAGGAVLNGSIYAMLRGSFA